MALIEFPPVSVFGRGPPPDPRAGDPRIVCLHGEHDVSTVQALAAELARAIAERTPA